VGKSRNPAIAAKLVAFASTEFPSGANFISGGIKINMKYSDARAQLRQVNLTPIVATVVGDRLPQNQRYVTSATETTFLDQSGASRATP